MREQTFQIPFQGYHWASLCLCPSTMICVISMSLKCSASSAIYSLRRNIYCFKRCPKRNTYCFKCQGILTSKNAKNKCKDK